MHAIANGETAIQGILGEDTIQQFVRVQIPESDPLLWENMIAVDQRWLVEPSNKKWNTTIETDANGIANIYMDFTGGRQANTRFGADTMLYSTPRMVEFRLIPQGDLIEEISIGLRANNGKVTEKHLVTDIPADELLKIQIDLEKLFGVQNDIAIYPVLLEFITFRFNTKATYQEYRIPVEGIYLYYDNIPEDPTVVENVSINNTAEKILLNGQLIIIKNNKI